MGSRHAPKLSSEGEQGVPMGLRRRRWGGGGTGAGTAAEAAAAVAVVGGVAAIFFRAAAGENKDGLLGWDQLDAR